MNHERSSPFFQFVYFYEPKGKMYDAIKPNKNKGEG